MPTLSLSCPHCKRIIKADTSQAGQIKTCSNCGQRVKIPGDEPEMSEAASALANIDRSPFRRDVETEEEPWFYAFLNGVAYTLLVVGILGAFMGTGIGMAGAKGVSPSVPVLLLSLLLLTLEIIGVLACSSVLLIFVDAARNIRRGRQAIEQTQRQP